MGPYLPIYGISCLLMGSFIIRYKSDLVTVFVMSAFVCTTVEYITSYILKKYLKLDGGIIVIEDLILKEESACLMLFFLE